MPGNYKSHHKRLIIFCRYPIPGKAKTRLIPGLGPVGAADLHRSFVEDVLHTVTNIALTGDTGIEVRFDGGSFRQIKKWLGPVPAYTRQGHGGLGERMYDAFIEAFQSGARRVILIGTDIPGLTVTHLKRAFEALDNNDIVLGPSTDGGYWLIGLNNPINLFHDISWGRETVLDETIALITKNQHRFHLLSPLRDIDTFDDLIDLNAEGSWKRPYLSVIIPTLNEEIKIGATIDSARDRDAEIIVSDGGSSDRTLKIARQKGVRIVSGIPGRSAQQNRGASICQGRNLLFLHADTLLPVGYVKFIFETLMDQKVLAGAFRFKTDSDIMLMKIIGFFANIRSGYLNMPYGDQGLFLRKSVFVSVGGFPDVPIAEDLFLIRRVAKAGAVKIASASAVTSARRWQETGPVRTTIINYLILAGCMIGISPFKLASLYNLTGKRGWN